MPATHPTPPAAVRLRADDTGTADVLTTRPTPPPTPPRDVEEALAVVTTWDDADLLPGGGQTLALWELLATTASGDVAAARAIEPTLDARAILAQAAHDPGGTPVTLPDGVATSGTWGVFAAEGPGVRLTARRDGGVWRLSGTKPWCSLADRLDAALVSAHLDDGDDGGAGGTRALFAVSLREDGVRVQREGWVSRGLAEIPSTPVAFDDVSATAVGAPGWYLTRPGFWWGGVGVAACWYGGAVGVARRVLRVGEQADEDAERLLGVVGILDERLADARRALAEAADAVERSAAGEPVDGRALARRVRASVARTCEDVLRHAAEMLGPAPLTQEEPYAKAVADLAVYLRQHHPWRESVALGRSVVAGGARW